MEIPTKKKDGGGDGSRSKEKTVRKKTPKEKAAGRSESDAANYVIPKVIRTPDEGAAARGNARGVNTRGGRGSRRGACFVCSMEGHYARDCPKSNSRYATVRGRGRGRGRGAPRVREKEL